MEIDDELFLFDRVWFPKVFKIARESGLDWLRMCAAADVLSNGDPRARQIDWEFIHSNMGLDNPIFSPMYSDEQPSVEIIDRGTRWGLFQIHGERAINFGHSGRLVNLIDITKNTQVACQIMTKQIQAVEMQTVPPDNIPRAAELALGWPVDLIDERVREFKIQMQDLLVFGD